MRKQKPVTSLNFSLYCRSALRSGNNSARVSQEDSSQEDSGSTVSERYSQ